VDVGDPRDDGEGALGSGDGGDVTEKRSRFSIGFLGGGNMAGALIRGLLESKTFPASRIVVSDVKKERLAYLAKTYRVGTTTDNHALVRSSEIVVLSVKPQVVDKVLTLIAPDVTREHLVVSIAAGVPLSALESRLPPRTRVVRTMPNVAALALAGATAITAGAHATAKDMRAATALFEAVGRVATLDESLLDAVTGLSGSGPAYVMLMIDALADGGVKVGLHRDTALLLAAQTVYGAAKLQLETQEHPGRLKDMVTSPGGTAIAGLHTLESGGLRRTLIDAVEVASRRSAELGAMMAAKMSRSRSG
jgi:pyrroline-5-carboxylate reductase